jgi:hypothetical protein
VTVLPDHERVHGHVFRLTVHGESEAVRQQGSEHLAQLVARHGPGGLGVDIEPLVEVRMRPYLLVRHFEGYLEQSAERRIASGKPVGAELDFLLRAAIGIGVERLRRPDRRNFERQARGVGLGTKRRRGADCHRRQEYQGEVLQHR